MSWEEGELREIEVGTSNKFKLRGKTRSELTHDTKEVPAPYDRIVAQLLAEDEHGHFDKGHEALRRQTFAQRVLDDFWKEIKSYEGPPAAFRSKVLTPILQRQLWGIEENQSMCVRNGVSNGFGTPTIADATEFYLGADPTDPSFITSYRRNMIYIPEARWHLGIVMGAWTVDNVKAFNAVRSNTDRIASAIRCDAAVEEFAMLTGKTTRMEGDEQDPEDPAEDDLDTEADQSGEPQPTLPPLLNKREVEVIYGEGLEAFFEPELSRVVGIPMLCISPAVLMISIQPQSILDSVIQRFLPAQSQDPINPAALNPPNPPNPDPPVRDSETGGSSLNPASVDPPIPPTPDPPVRDTDTGGSSLNPAAVDPPNPPNPGPSGGTDFTGTTRPNEETTGCDTTRNASITPGNGSQDDTDQPFVQH